MTHKKLFTYLGWSLVIVAFITNDTEISVPAAMGALGCWVAYLFYEKL